MSRAWDSAKQFIVYRMTPPFLVKSFARPYVAGDSIESALQTARALHGSRGVLSTLDILGEEVASPAGVNKQVDLYLRLVHRIEDPARCTISLKPSAMGLELSEELAEESIGRIVDAAAPAGIATTIDMEDHRLTSATLRLHRRMRERHSAALLGTVLQSRLFRTASDIDDLSDLPSRIRLVIGIYKEPAEVAHTRKREIKEKFLVLLRRLIEGGHTVEIATHDENLIQRSRRILEELQVPRSSCEFQMLLGVPREALQQRLVSEGHVVRIYVPFADNWGDAIAYLKRRMVENPSMAGMVLKNLFSPGGNGASR
jgi:proline dehydrogenase